MVSRYSGELKFAPTSYGLYGVGSGGILSFGSRGSN